MLCLFSSVTNLKHYMTNVCKYTSHISLLILEKSREITPEGMKKLSQSGNNTQWWMWLVVKAKSGVLEQCCRGTWNVKSMNQGKLEVVKQEMARVNINISALSELKWTETGEFNSDDQYIYYIGKCIIDISSLLKKWSCPHSQKKSLKCNTWWQSQKRQSDLCSFPRQTIQYHSSPSLCPKH